MRRRGWTSKLALTMAGLMCLLGAFAFGSASGGVAAARTGYLSSLFSSSDPGVNDNASFAALAEQVPVQAVASAEATSAGITVTVNRKAPVVATPVATVVEEEPAAVRPAEPTAAAKPPVDPPLPPSNLQGSFVPVTANPYVNLTWQYNGSAGSYKTFNIYRADLTTGEVPIAPYVTDKRSPYDDYNLTLTHVYRYWVVTVGKDGSESPASNTVDVETYNVTPPSTPTGFAAWAIDPGVTLSWNANPEADVTGYKLYTSNTQTGTRTLIASSITGTSYYHTGGSATIYYWVGAVNVRGLESPAAMAYPTLTVPEVIQEDDPRVTTTSTWATEHYVGPNDGKLKVSGIPGARLTLSFLGSQVKMTAAKYWSCGDADIYLDGKYYTTINLNSESASYNVVVLNIPGLVHGNHTLTVEVAGSGGAPADPSQGTEAFSFVNVDSFEVR